MITALRAEITAKINDYINRNLNPTYELDLPFWNRVNRWHWHRMIHDNGPIFWCLKHIWCFKGFHWLYQLRCRNVAYRIELHRRRQMAKAPNRYDWSR